METKRQKTIRLLTRAGIEDPESTSAMSDAELMELNGIGKKSLSTIRQFWPTVVVDSYHGSTTTLQGSAKGPHQDSGTEAKPSAVPVYQFGLKGSAEKAKRGGVRFDMGKIAPHLWGPLILRIRSLTSAAVMAAADRAQAEVMASTPGREVALGKIREEVNADSGDQALSAVVLAASFTMLSRPTRTQQLEIEWRRLLASVRGIEGEAAFSEDPEDVTTLTGNEPAEEVQGLIATAIQYSDKHQQSIAALVRALDELDDTEIVRLGEDYVVTELPSASSLASVMTKLSVGK